MLSVIIFAITFSIYIKRDDLETIYSDEPTYEHYNGSKFLKFEQASEEFVSDLLKKYPFKTCCLDPMPTELVKKCPELVPLITKILKTSLSTCVVVVPLALKYQEYGTNSQVS